MENKVNNKIQNKVINKSNPNKNKTKIFNINKHASANKYSSNNKHGNNKNVHKVVNNKNKKQINLRHSLKNPFHRAPGQKFSKSGIMLIVSCAIIAIPVFTFIFILLSASFSTGKPIIAGRFKNDLVPSISSTNQTSIRSSVSLIEGVEDCEVVLKTAQLRINIDVNDDLDKDDIVKIANEAYDAVTEILPVSTYFKIGDSGEKMYDLSISVYNYSSPSSSNEFIYYVITKNSKMDSPSKQFISEPISPELAKELRGEKQTSEDDELSDEGNNE